MSCPERLDVLNYLCRDVVRIVEEGSECLVTRSGLSARDELPIAHRVDGDSGTSTYGVTALSAGFNFVSLGAPNLYIKKRCTRVTRNTHCSKIFDELVVITKSGNKTKVGNVVSLNTPLRLSGPVGNFPNVAIGSAVVRSYVVRVCLAASGAIAVLEVVVGGSSLSNATASASCRRGAGGLCEGVGVSGLLNRLFSGLRGRSCGGRGGRLLRGA